MHASEERKQGTLYIVATPIGNLEDITLRALRILKEVDLIAAEDTRHSRILANAYQIKTPMISLHEHNERSRSEQVISKIQQGMNVAYISDAGSPCISDPGHLLVQRAVEYQIKIVPVPGPSALTAALSVCGFPSDEFLFCGFLPSREHKRRLFLESVARQEQTLVFYESPSRIPALLDDIRDVLGDRRIVTARELTKVYEEISRGLVSEVAAMISERKTKGEFTVIVQGAFPEKVLLTDQEIEERLTQILENRSLSLRDAVSEMVRQTGESRKKIYQVAVKIRKISDSH